MTSGCFCTSELGQPGHDDKDRVAAAAQCDGRFNTAAGEQQGVLSRLTQSLQVVFSVSKSVSIIVLVAISISIS